MGSSDRPAMREAPLCTALPYHAPRGTARPYSAGLERWYRLSLQNASGSEGVKMKRPGGCRARRVAMRCWTEPCTTTRSGA